MMNIIYLWPPFFYALLLGIGSRFQISPPAFYYFCHYIFICLQLLTASRSKFLLQNDCYYCGTGRIVTPKQLCLKSAGKWPTLMRTTSTARSPLAQRLYLRLCRSYISPQISRTGFLWIGVGEKENPRGALLRRG